jgi:hypothetical protein
MIPKEKPLDLCITDLRDPCSPRLKVTTHATSKRSGEQGIKMTCGDTPWWSWCYCMRQNIKKITCLDSLSFQKKNL